MGHVCLQCRHRAHHGCAGGCPDDQAAVIGFIVEADHATSVMYHLGFLIYWAYQNQAVYFEWQSNI
jgi:hypothetical protein